MLDLNEQNMDIKLSEKEYREVPVYKNLYGHSIRIPMPPEKADFKVWAETNSPHSFGIVVKDESMEYSFYENDILICEDNDEAIKDGSIVIAIQKKNNEIIKNARRIHYLNDGDIFLQPFNVPDFLPDTFEKTEILKLYKIISMIRNFD